MQSVPSWVWCLVVGCLAANYVFLNILVFQQNKTLSCSVEKIIQLYETVSKMQKVMAIDSKMLESLDARIENVWDAVFPNKNPSNRG